MAKRFTDTNKYKKSFVRSLPGAYKLFWDFLYHDCDNAGIWIIDFDIAQTYVGKDMPISKDEALRLFNEDEERIVEIAGGKKWFIPSFIEFQYGHLSEKNKAHSTVILILKKLNLIDESLQLIKNLRPLKAPLQGAKEMVMEKEKEMDKEEDFGMSENLLAPQMVRVFKSCFPKYPEDREVDFPACIQIAFKIAKSNGWMKEAVTNGKMKDTVAAWESIVQFSSTDDWLKTRSIPDFNKEYQRIIQKMNANERKPSTVVGKNIEFDRP